MRPEPRELVESVPFVSCATVRKVTGFELGAKGIILWQYVNDVSEEELSVSVIGSDLLLFESVQGPPFARTVTFTSTCPNFGGRRYWFRCCQCDRRAACLYLTDTTFGCRDCCKLVYYSTRVSHFLPRAYYWATKMEKAIGIQPAVQVDLRQLRKTQG